MALPWRRSQSNQNTKLAKCIPRSVMKASILTYFVCAIPREPTSNRAVTACRGTKRDNMKNADTSSEHATASRDLDLHRCEQLPAIVRNTTMDNERTPLGISSNSFPAASAASPRASTTNGCSESKTALLIESPDSLLRLLSALKQGDLPERLRAASTVKDILAHGGARADAIAEAEGLVEALTELVKERISTGATNAALVAIYYTINQGKKTAARAVDAGLVPAIVEVVVDAKRSVCEKALAVLERLLNCERGRDRVREHALAVPVLVKKMLRVSETATELAVSALWRLCENCGEGGGERRGCLLAAVEVGAFQKLILLLQVGCREETRGRATDLLKLLNGYRTGHEGNGIRCS